ncbi:hypothetical protein AWC18_01390 [Mycolicibacter nonchromogenicus]|uniref:Tetratricopeptide repeat protein n=1 Tax=Mycolicibacter nonchromogenicus TaxID=1782 RepID=A0A1X1ZSZ8_MYCNO|nr:hypothetical protein AWC18_01390 [Mycolicibacter nonchromogenicus]
MASAFLLSLESVTGGRSGEHTRRVLEIIACLSPEGVPREVLYRIAENDGANLTESVIDQTLESCVGSSLLQWSEDGHLVIMHRLTARVMREAAIAKGRLNDVLADCAALLEGQTIPEDQAWSQRDFGAQLASQIEALWTAAGHLLDNGAVRGAGELVDRLLSLRFWSVRQLWKSADLAFAVRLGEQVVADSSRVKGDADPRSITAAFNLALCYESAGRLRQAIPLLERVAESQEELHGAASAETLEAKQQLAAALRSAGRIHDAMQMFEQVLPAREEVLGDAHRATIATRIDLAGTYESVGRLAEAIPLFEAGLQQRIAVLGDLHSHTLSARKHLAAAYESAGRTQEAIDLFQTTLAQRQSVLGVDHPHTLISWNDLAHAYESNGRLDDANLLYRQNAEDRTRILGQDHPDTISSWDDLAFSAFLLGQLDTAEQICCDVSARANAILGEGHPNAINLLSTSAWCRLANDAPSDAVDRFSKVFVARQHLLGDEYPDSIVARHDLGIAQFLMSNTHGAFESLARAKSDFERILGADHPITQNVTMNASMLRSLPQATRVRWVDIRDSVKIPRWRPGRRIVKRPLD